MMTKSEFPNHCNQCGFCCIAEICPVGLSKFGGPKHRRCPALRQNNGLAVCGIYEDFPQEVKDIMATILGIGNGCDTSARVLFHGKFHDFAFLSDEMKNEVVRQLNNETLPLIHTKKEIMA